MNKNKVEACDAAGEFDAANASAASPGYVFTSGDVEAVNFGDGRRFFAVPAGPVSAVLDEMDKALAKYPTWPSDPLHALAVLGEEFGELTKAMLQLSYEPHKTSGAAVREEALQTAAMALRLVESLDRYQYRPSVQHRQEPRP